VSSINKRGGSWRARYRDMHGREHSKNFARKVEAQDWLKEVEASLTRGDYITPRNAKVTVREYASHWEPLQLGREATARITDNALRIHILPALGDMPMSSLVRSDIQGFVKGLSATLAPGTVRNVYDVLFRMLDFAVADKVIASNPCKRIALPEMPTNEVKPLTVEQVTAIAEAVDDRYTGLVWLLAGSGLRISEALGLDVEHVDFLRRTVKVERQLLQSGEFGLPKTEKSRRVVPVGQVVIDALAAHLAMYPSHGPLFTDQLDNRLTYRQWKMQWAQVRRATGLTNETTHDLRHFAASALISGGASVKQVQTFLGHASAAITLKVYSHMWPGDEDRTRDVLDAVLAKASVS
jgi:integrase